MNFKEWIDTLIEEKGINTETTFEIEGPGGLNIIPIGVVVDAIKNTTESEQAKIKTTLVKIDFMNGDICHFLRHLAGAIAR